MKLISYNWTVRRQKGKPASHQGPVMMSPESLYFCSSKASGEWKDLAESLGFGWLARENKVDLGVDSIEYEELDPEIRKSEVWQHAVDQSQLAIGGFQKVQPKQVIVVSREAVSKIWLTGNMLNRFMEFEVGDNHFRALSNFGKKATIALFKDNEWPPIA